MKRTDQMYKNIMESFDHLIKLARDQKAEDGEECMGAVCLASETVISTLECAYEDGYKDGYHAKVQ